jgi:hypothetical protein
MVGINFSSSTKPSDKFLAIALLKAMQLIKIKNQITLSCILELYLPMVEILFLKTGFTPN